MRLPGANIAIFILSCYRTMRIIRSFFCLPPDYGPGKLAIVAAVCFAMAALSVSPALNPDAGIPAISALEEASGQVGNIDAARSAVRFRLAGRTGAFEYPAKARGYAAVEHALRTAGSRRIGVLFTPAPRSPGPDADAHHVVWQLSIDGKIVRSFAETRAGWRSDNRVALGILVFSLAAGSYFAALAIRAWRSRPFR